MMRRISLVFAIAALCAESALAQDVPRGAEVSFLYGGEQFTVLFWPLPGRLSISRGMQNLGGGAFPTEVAQAVASAALAQYGLSCDMNPPELYGGVPGLYDVYYTC